MYKYPMWKYSSRKFSITSKNDSGFIKYISLSIQHFHTVHTRQKKGKKTVYTPQHGKDRKLKNKRHFHRKHDWTYQAVSVFLSVDVHSFMLHKTLPKFLYIFLTFIFPIIHSLAISK